ncbi:hypothetical protein M378DRAFT_172685 [Amanita muscaria Koide BX008]|uniref:Uncharacterized protein n=1 Tax=Amanita muscaria (strain Koide BX008) TaxID=946122 RepID=A0A0C2WJX8_AMAMK|nr:hypothetical protein M378DRAFT_172685 [Amanita muscaria Koide BX008]
MGHTEGYKRKGILFGTNKVKFRHILFEAIGSDEGSDDSGSGTQSSGGAELPPQFTIAGWPAYYSQAQEELKNMVNTHRVRYLLAFDMNGHLIEPSEYRKHLQGALVQVHFTVTRWAIGARKGDEAWDTFVADIHQMRVLSPPASYGKPVVPRKLKFVKRDPITPDITPKKFKTFAKSDPSVRKRGEKESEAGKEGKS